MADDIPTDTAPKAAAGTEPLLPMPETALLALPPVARATVLAGWLHRKQRRKYGGGEYIVHPLTVAATAARLGVGESGIVAALLHDTVEDTAADFSLIERLFGRETRDCVSQLTHAKFPDKAARMEYFRRHVPTMSLTAVQIKLADRLGNLLDCDQADDRFITRYTTESMVIVDAIPADKQNDPVVRELSAQIRARVAVLQQRLK